VKNVEKNVAEWEKLLNLELDSKKIDKKIEEEEEEENDTSDSENDEKNEKIKRLYTIEADEEEDEEMKAIVHDKEEESKII